MATTTHAPAAEIRTDDGPERRPFITIDGSSYDLAVPGDLGISAQAKMQRLVARWEAFNSANAADLTDEQADDLETSLRWAPTALVLNCPAEVLAKLNDEQCAAILTAFSVAVVAAQATTTKTTSQQTSRRKS